MARTNRSRRNRDHDVERQVAHASLMAAGRPTARNRQALRRARLAASVLMTARIEQLGWVS